MYINFAAINLKIFSEVEKFCSENNVGLVVVGPEDPLADGITDYLTDKGILLSIPLSTGDISTCQV